MQIDRESQTIGRGRLYLLQFLGSVPHGVLIGHPPHLHVQHLYGGQVGVAALHDTHNHTVKCSTMMNVPEHGDNAASDVGSAVLQTTACLVEVWPWLYTVE